MVCSSFAEHRRLSFEGFGPIYKFGEERVWNTLVVKGKRLKSHGNSTIEHALEHTMPGSSAHQPESHPARMHDFMLKHAATCEQTCLGVTSMLECTNSREQTRSSALFPLKQKFHREQARSSAPVHT